MLLFVVFHVDRSLGLADQHRNHAGDTKGGSVGRRGSLEDLARANMRPPSKRVSEHVPACIRPKFGPLIPLFRIYLLVKFTVNRGLVK